MLFCHLSKIRYLEVVFLNFIYAFFSVFFDFLPFFTKSHRFFTVFDKLKFAGLRFCHREKGFTAEIADATKKIATAITPRRNDLFFAADCSDFG